MKKLTFIFKFLINFRFSASFLDESNFNAQEIDVFVPCSDRSKTKPKIKIETSEDQNLLKIGIKTKNYFCFNQEHFYRHRLEYHDPKSRVNWELC